MHLDIMVWPAMNILVGVTSFGDVTHAHQIQYAMQHLLHVMPGFIKILILVTAAHQSRVILLPHLQRGQHQSMSAIFQAALFRPTPVDNISSHPTAIINKVSYKKTGA